MEEDSTGLACTTRLMVVPLIETVKAWGRGREDKEQKSNLKFVFILVTFEVSTRHQVEV